MLCYITFETNYQIDLTGGNFADLIGFNKTIIRSSSYGTTLPDITRSLNVIQIHTNIGSESIISGKSTDVIYQFPTDELPPSFPFKKEGRRLLFNKIKTNRIKGLRIYITDSLGREVDVNGIPVNLNLNLIIRPG